MTHRPKEGYVILLGATLAVSHPVGTFSRRLTSSSVHLCLALFSSWWLLVWPDSQRRTSTVARAKVVDRARTNGHTRSRFDMVRLPGGTLTAAGETTFTRCCYAPTTTTTMTTTTTTINTNGTVSTTS